MPSNSYVQTSFLGGVWSGFAQGRRDDPRYPTALARFHNAVVGEEGSWIKRSGFLWRAPTRRGEPAVLRAWRFSQIAAYLGEFSDRRLRFWSDGVLITDSLAVVEDISADDPAELTVTQVPSTWLTGDDVFLEFNDIDSLIYAPVLANRHFTVVIVDETTVTLKDALTGAGIDGSTFTGSFNGATLRRVLTLRAPYAEDELDAIRKVQLAELNVDRGLPESKVLFLHGSHQPQYLSSLDSFTIGLRDVVFDDGPYMDPPSDIVSLDPSAIDGLIQLTLSAGAADWEVGTTYDKGDLVHTVASGVQHFYWVSLHGGNVGNSPGGIGGGIPLTADWALLPVNWRADVTYALGEATLDRDEFTNTTRVFFSQTFSNLGNRPTESPDDWSETPPTWESGVTYTGAPTWVLFEGSIWVGKLAGGGGGPPFPEPPDSGAWVDGLTPLAVFQLFPNINDGRGFLTTDVGRCIRLQAGPQPWDVATSYSGGDEVSFIGNSYVALGNNTGVQPDRDPATWELQPVGPTWTWGRIAYSNQVVSEDIDTWVGGSDYDIGEIVAWGNGVDLGEAPTNAYVTLIDNNPNTPPQDPTVVYAGGWLRVGEFVDYDTVPQIVATPWLSDEYYGMGAFVYIDGDVTLYAAVVDGASGSPDASSDWVEVLAVEATTIGSPGSIYVLIEGDPLPSTDLIWNWRLGLYSDTTGWPTCGAFHEGRLCLAGPQKNRVDLSMSNQPFVFSPTAPDGTVSDGNAFDQVFNFHDQNDIFWLSSETVGLLCGTLAGEILVSASQLDDPLTPFSKQSRLKTDYGCANTEPEHTPSASVIVHARQRKLLEYMDQGSGKWEAVNLNQMSKAVTVGGAEEIAYQQERLPVVWGRTGEDAVFGVAYKRDKQQEYAAAQTHEHGAEHTFTSIAVQVDETGTSENLWAITFDGTYYNVEFMYDTFEEDASLNDAMFVDMGVRPVGAKWINTPAPNGSIVFYGLWPHVTAGEALAVAAPFDLGDFTVSATGTVTVPFTATFTPETLIPLITVATNTTSGPGAAIEIDFTGAPFEDDLPPLDEGEHYEIMAAVGYPYDSEGQMLPPLEGGANGPSFAKTRRNARAGIHLWRTHEVRWGTDFDDLKPLSLREKNERTAIGISDLKTGIIRDTVQAEYSLTEQLAWRCTRPMPAVVLAIGGFSDLVDV